MNKILAIDDEQDLLSVIKRYFSLLGYEVITACNGKEGIEKIYLNPDIILLDISMPEMDGYETCKLIRESVQCPILFLTARNELKDKVHGFEIGADDYIVKPFELEELHARIEAHIRRGYRSKEKNSVTFRDELTIDYQLRKVEINGQEIQLSKKEYDLIAELTMNTNSVLSREQLYVKIWGYDKMGNNDTVTEHISKIRIKLSKYTDHNYIKTIWGCGYTWNS